MKKKIYWAIVGIVALFIASAMFRVKTIKPHTSADFAKVTVMITGYDGRSGGTGVIVSSETNQSKILTNAHVCELLRSGGIIRSDSKRGVVKHFQISTVHDLCLITTSTNFNVNTVIAQSEPDIYEDAIVSGHPHLLPVIITKGIFSQKELINVMINVRPCSPDEVVDEKKGEYCLLMGGIPVIRAFEAQVVSATIMPGSSGSAVFNANGEISGVVFAGSGDFGYAFVVPLEYIISFFDSEVSTLSVNYPNMEAPIFSLKKKTNWSKLCSGDVTETQQKICELITKNLILTN